MNPLPSGGGPFFLFVVQIKFSPNPKDRNLFPN